MWQSEIADFACSKATCCINQSNCLLPAAGKLILLRWVTSQLSMPLLPSHCILCQNMK